MSDKKTLEEILDYLLWGTSRMIEIDLEKTKRKAKQAITQHLLDVIERAKPEKLTLNPKTYDRNEYEMRAYNQAIDQFHQNIIKELADE